jgi:hypothetical protein
VYALGLAGCSEPKSTALPHPHPLRKEGLAGRCPGGLQSSREGRPGRTWGDTCDSIDPLALNIMIITIQVGLTMAAYWPQLLSMLPPQATLKRTEHEHLHSCRIQSLDDVAGHLRRCLDDGIHIVQLRTLPWTVAYTRVLELLPSGASGPCASA